MTKNDAITGGTIRWLFRQWAIITVSSIPFLAALMVSVAMDLPHLGWFIAGAIGSQLMDEINTSLRTDND